MIKEIEIQIGDQVFVADMLNKKAPKTCEAIKSILPLARALTSRALIEGFDPCARKK